MNRSPEADAEETVSPPLEHYLDGAIRLRQAAEWNAFDSNAEKKLPERIIPIVDADVIRMFMAPAEETHYVEPFPNSHADSAERRQWDDPLALVAAATAEFIFLTDKIQVLNRKVGKWNEPLRMTPAHSRDVESMLYQVRSKIVDGLESIEDLEDEVIDRLDPLIEQSRRDRDQGLTRLVSALPTELRDLYLGPIYEAERWIRLRSQEMLLRLDGLPEATTEVLEPKTELVERWREPLFRSVAPSMTRAREHGRHLDAEAMKRRMQERRERAQERAKRDAMALACVTALNEAGLKEGLNNGWRAILISGDDHLHRVYAEWTWKTLGARMRPEHYVLRRPLQFTPVLNVASMSDEWDTVRIFHKLTAALDLAVDMVLGGSERSPTPYLLEYYWDRHRAHWLRGLDQRGIQSHLETCKEFWLEAINHINARNHPYLTRDYHKLLKRLRVAFDEPDARQGLIESTQSLVEDIDAEHFNLVLQETIYELAKLSAPMRMPFLVRTEFPEFLPEEAGSITRFLYGRSQALPVTRPKLDQLRAIAQRIQDSPGARATFLTAILAAVGGAYVRASRLIGRVQRLARDESQEAGLLAETTYFQAVVMRLTVNQREDYESASRLARQLPVTASGDVFQQTRGYSENAALELQWYATDALRARNSSISAEQKSHLEEAGRCLKLARDLMPWGETPAGRFERELAQQIIVNAIALNAYVKLGGGEPDLDALRWARQQFDALLGGAGQPDYLTELWRRAALWLTEPTEENKAALQQHCQATLGESLTNETPTGDRNDLEYILAYLQGAPDAVEK